MKPSPPDSLLARGQTWTVVEAPWSLLPGPFKEQFTCTGYRCDAVGVVYSLDKNIITTTLCHEHLGNHRWIEDGKVWQWRADPPFDNDAHKRRIEERRRRDRAANVH